GGTPPTATGGGRGGTGGGGPNNSLPADARKGLCRTPDAPLSPPQCYLRGPKRIIARPLHIEQPLPERRQRQKRRLRVFWEFGPCGSDMREMPAAAQAELCEHRANLRGRAHRENIVCLGAIVPKQIQGNI